MTAMAITCQVCHDNQYQCAKCFESSSFLQLVYSQLLGWVFSFVTLILVQLKSSITNLLILDFGIFTGIILMSVLGQKIRNSIIATPVVLTVLLLTISLTSIASLGKNSLLEKGEVLAIVTAETVKAGVQYGVFDDVNKLLGQ